MEQSQSLNNYKIRTKRKGMRNTIQVVKSGIGKYQKGEGDIICTYPNADLAVKAMLKFIQD